MLISDYSKSTYFTLLELLLEIVDVSGVKHPIRSRKPSDVPQFKNPGIISTIFELVCLSGDTGLQQRVLEDFQFLLRVYLFLRPSSIFQYSQINRTIFLEQHWQSWLFGLLASYSNQNALNITGAARREVKTLIYDLFTLLHHQSLTQPDGWVTMMQSETLLEYFCARGFFQEQELKKALHVKLFHAIIKDTALSETKDLRLWNLIAKWAGSMEEFLFYEPPSQNVRQLDQLTLELNSSGQWNYFQLAQQFADFVDVLLERFTQASTGGEARAFSISDSV